MYGIETLIRIKLIKGLNKIDNLFVGSIYQLVWYLICKLEELSSSPMTFMPVCLSKYPINASSMSWILKKQQHINNKNEIKKIH